MSIVIRSDDVMKPPSCFECIATDCKLELVTQCEFGQKLRAGEYRLKDFEDDYIDDKCPVEAYPPVGKLFVDFPHQSISAGTYIGGDKSPKSIFDGEGGDGDD